MDKRVYLVLGSVFLLLAVVNQNCSRVQVSDATTQASSAVKPLGQAEDCNVTGTCPQAPAPSPTPTPTPPPPPPAITEFQCKKIIKLPFSNTLQIPPRDESGNCYSVKLLDAIANSSSSLTQDIDSEVISRDHDRGGSGTRHPYVLGDAVVDLILSDRRFVKLSGFEDKLASIRVDNFILAGIFPKLAAGQLPAISYYKSYGTTDSTIPGTDGISFRNQSVKLNSFGAAGTSTVSALDITSNIEPNQVYTLDLRALDCGGSRELSDVYLLFQ